MTNTPRADLLIELANEAIEHAERHGFAPMEEYDAWVIFSETQRREAIFRIVHRRSATFEVEVIKHSSHSMWRAGISGADYTGHNSTDPAADYLDDLEGLLVEAKRLLV